MSQTDFHNLKDIWAIEVRLYFWLHLYERVSLQSGSLQELNSTVTYNLTTNALKWQKVAVTMWLSLGAVCSIELLVYFLV